MKKPKVSVSFPPNGEYEAIAKIKVDGQVIEFGADDAREAVLGLRDYAWQEYGVKSNSIDWDGYC